MNSLPPSPARAARASTVRALFLLVVVGGAIAFGVVRAVRAARARVSGSVRAAGTPAGSFSFAVDNCASGHAFVPGFFGADLRGGGQFDLRLVDSGDDAQLWLFPPGGKRGATLYAKADCGRWDVLNDWTNLMVNRVRTVSGHVHVTCDGRLGSLTADVDFARCAY